MSYFAKVEDGRVVEVISAEQEFIDTLKGNDTWIQTSYNTKGGKHYDPETGEEDDKPPLRKNYAGIDYYYDENRDAFIPPQPFPSWILNEDTCWWEAPVPYPEITDAEGDIIVHIWNEQEKNWVIENTDN